ncbi:HAAS signaling domain-containing protein [Catenulispora subtropica]
MSTETEDLTAAYLAELEREAARLPWNARAELLEDVRSHIEVALAEMREDASGGPEAAIADGDEISHVRAMLAALGEPREIVAAALADEAPPTPSSGPAWLTPPSPEPAWPTPPLLISTPMADAAPEATQPSPLGLQEIFAIVLLVAGGFLFGVGWLAGLLLLWNSPRWSVRDKLVGTFVLPGGYAGLLMIIARPVNDQGFVLPSWLGMPVLFLLAVAPLASAVFLFLRARRHPAGTGSPAGKTIGLAVLGIVGGIAALMVVGAVMALSASSGSGSGSVQPSSGGPAPSYSGGAGVESGSVVPVESPVSSDSSSR